MSIQTDQEKLKRLLAKVEIALGLVGQRRCDFDRAIKEIEWLRDNIERGTPIDMLAGLSETIIEILARARVQTVEELALLTDADLLLIAGIQRGRMADIDIALTRNGYQRLG